MPRVTTKLMSGNAYIFSLTYIVRIFHFTLNELSTKYKKTSKRNAKRSNSWMQTNEKRGEVEVPKVKEYPVCGSYFNKN